jgi:cystathionine gamma-synthase
VLFPAYQSADDCQAYITSQKFHSTNAANPQDVWLVLVEFKRAQEMRSAAEDIFFVPHLYGVVHPSEFRKTKMSFWRLTGTGISSRLAESWLHRDFTITRISSPPLKASPPIEPPVYSTIRERVAELLNRGPINPARTYRAKSEDVYLYPTGMAALIMFTMHYRDGGTLMLSCWVFPTSLVLR